jgi:hypothetical protein
MGLEELAARAARRGAIAVAVSALERASKLSADPARRCERMLGAAELAFQLGQSDLVGRLVDEASRLEAAAQQRGRMTWIRERFTDGVPGDPGRVALLVQAAEEALFRGEC